MPLTRSALLVGLALLVWCRVGHAVPAPMPAQELAQKADLVAEVEVTGVSCAGPPTDKRDFVATEYRSQLSVVRVISGTAAEPITLSGYRIEWKREAPTGGAPPTPPLARGWRGKVYLQKLPGGGWMPVWWNALEEDPAASKPEPLPACGKKGCSGCAVPGTGDASSPLLVLLALGWLRRAARRPAARLTRW